MGKPTPVHLVAAAVAALIAVTGCEEPTTAAQPGGGEEPTPAASLETAAAEPTPIASAVPTELAPVPIPSPASTSSSLPADDLLKSSAAATENVTNAYVRYSTTGFESLTATAWGADVTLAPPMAKGTGMLLVDGVRNPTGFEVSGGRLTIENADGSHEDVGPSRGVLNPPSILDPSTGIAAIVAAATATETAAEPTEIEGVPMLRVRAQLPAGAAAALLPPENASGSAPLPVTFWLDPAGGNRLRQLILNVGAGSVTVRLDSPSS